MHLPPLHLQAVYVPRKWGDSKLMAAMHSDVLAVDYLSKNCSDVNSIAAAALSQKRLGKGFAPPDHHPVHTPAQTPAHTPGGSSKHRSEYRPSPGAECSQGSKLETSRAHSQTDYKDAEKPAAPCAQTSSRAESPPPEHPGSSGASAQDASKNISKDFASPIAGDIGESWDISSYPGADCLMLNGPLQGHALSELLAEHAEAVLGKEWNSYNDFPLLQKFLAPKSDLPLQVHPHDNYARKHEGQNGKAECWYILDCPPGAYIWLGLKNVEDMSGLSEILKTGKIADFMQRVPAKPGDVFCIPPGLLHGLGAGCLAYEVQQNSDVTYRLDDFGLGIDSDQTRREHQQKALEVISLELNQAAMGPITNWAEDDGFCNFNPYFSFGSLHGGPVSKLLPQVDNALGLTVLSGKGILLADGAGFSIEKGQSWLLPAALHECAVLGDCHILYSIFPK